MAVDDAGLDRGRRCATGPALISVGTTDGESRRPRPPGRDRGRPRARAAWTPTSPAGCPAGRLSRGDRPGVRAEPTSRRSRSRPPARPATTPSATATTRSAAARWTIALCGGADALCRKTFTGFYRLGTIAPERCQPFDKDRKGILTGEGAGVLVLETLESALARGARIYAEVLGYGLNCDAHHPVAPDQDSIAALHAARPGRTPGSSRTRSTSSPRTAPAPRPTTSPRPRAIREVFGDDAPPRTVSIKSMIGHTMGAASALASIACALALTEGFIPPTINHVETDPECGLDCVPNEAVDGRAADRAEQRPRLRRQQRRRDLRQARADGLAMRRRDVSWSPARAPWRASATASTRSSRRCARAAADSAELRGFDRRQVPGAGTPTRSTTGPAPAPTCPAAPPPGCCAPSAEAARRRPGSATTWPGAGARRHRAARAALGRAVRGATAPRSTPSRLHFGTALRERFGAARTYTFANACSASLYALAARPRPAGHRRGGHRRRGRRRHPHREHVRAARPGPAEPPDRVRPFDRGPPRGAARRRRRGGGAAPGRSPARGAGALGRLRAVSMNCDARHVTAPDPRGIARAMPEAHAAGRASPPSDIDLVLLHGTGTAAQRRGRGDRARRGLRPRRRRAR